MPLFPTSNYSQSLLSPFQLVIESVTLDIGLWTLDIGHWTLDLGLWTLDIGHWTLDIGHWTLDLVFDRLIRDCRGASAMIAAAEYLRFIYKV